MTPIEHDPDIAQAQVFLHLLNTEIDVLTARIGETEADINRGLFPDRLGARVLPEDPGFTRRGCPRARRWPRSPRARRQS